MTTKRAKAAVISALVTNVNTGGQWIVVQTVTSRHGPFATQAEAQAFADALAGKPQQRDAP